MSEKLTLSEPDALSVQDAVESSARSYPRSLPMAPVAASGAWIESATGEKYLDCLAGGQALLPWDITMHQLIRRERVHCNQGRFCMVWIL